MVLRNLLIVTGLWLGLGFALAPQDAAAATARKCLSKEQQRNAVATGKAVPLAIAMRSSKNRTPGEVVRAQLCEEPNGSLVYLLTVLPRNGKVTRTVIDAADGAIAGER